MTCEIISPEPRTRSELRDELGFHLHARLIRARAALPPAHPHHEPDEATPFGPIFLCSEISEAAEAWEPDPLENTREWKA